LIITEHVPEKLGKTVHEIYIPKATNVFSKRRFSVFNEEITKCIDSQSKPVLVFYGIEAHICVLQSCLDAIKYGYHVLLVADAISSRKEYSKKIALKMMGGKGVEIVTTEMLLFRLLRDADHEKFKDIAKMVK
jgi:isochorismate hydrolase